MADELTSTGLVIDDLETRRADIVTALRASISPQFDVSPDKPTGQIIDIFNERLQSAFELLQTLHSSFDPAQATGQSEDGVCSITGTYRNAATFGTVTLTLNLNAATTVPAGSQAAVSGDPDNIWILDADVTSVGAGNYDGTATAQTAGAIEAPAGTITVIVTPVAGWNTVTNALDATAGEERETDAELRARRVNEIFQAGSASSQSLQAAVSALTWVEEAIVYANDYWRASPATPDPDYIAIGVIEALPPNCVEVVIDKDTNLSAAEVAELAELIYEEKASGIQAYGTDIGDGTSAVNTSHTDTQGNIHIIGWTRADKITIHIEVNFTAATDLTDDYIGDTALKAAIVAWGDTLTIGEDVIYYQLLSTVMSQTGVENLTDLEVGLVDPPAGLRIDVPIGTREIANIDTANIDIIGGVP